VQITLFRASCIIFVQFVFSLRNLSIDKLNGITSWDPGQNIDDLRKNRNLRKMPATRDQNPRQLDYLDRVYFVQVISIYDVTCFRVKSWVVHLELCQLRQNMIGCARARLNHTQCGTPTKHHNEVAKPDDVAN